MEDLRKYIIARIDEFNNPNNYYYGYFSREQIICGLQELERLARRMRIDVGIASFNVPNFVR